MRWQTGRRSTNIEDRRVYRSVHIFNQIDEFTARPHIGQSLTGRNVRSDGIIRREQVWPLDEITVARLVNSLPEAIDRVTLITEAFNSEYNQGNLDELTYQEFAAYWRARVEP
jgi:hypothetical protein